MRANIARSEGVAYPRHHTVDVLNDMVVPEAHHTIAGKHQRIGSCSVRSVAVVTAIDFNDQPRLDAQKVGDESSDGLLPAKLIAVELAVSKFGP